MIDNKELFTHKSGDYSRFRPGYPAAAVDYLKKQTSGGKVVDIGAGTGIFTQALLRCFTDVSAVEPNANMRNEFKQQLPDIICSDGSGEATKLAADSVDLITVAQAFHWLDADLFKQEAMRILRNNGKVAIVWNTSLQSDFTCERNKICQKYCPRFRSGHAGKHSPEEGDRFLRNIFFRSVEAVAFDNPFVMDEEAFEGNIRSRSYALAPQDAGYGDFMAELRNVFNKYAENGTVTEPQETQIYLGSF